MANPVATFDPIASLRTYRRERAARLSACRGGEVTKFTGYYIWWCSGCGEEFDSEAQACAPKHVEPCKGETCSDDECANHQGEGEDQ